MSAGLELETRLLYEGQLLDPSNRQKIGAALDAGLIVGKEGFRERRAAHRTGADIRLRLNEPNRAARDRPVWDRVSGLLRTGRRVYDADHRKL